MPAQAPVPRLTDEQLRDVLRLTKGSDSVELKLTVPASGQRSAIRSLGVDPLDAQIRQVYFFDTPDLTLYESGLNLRARRIQGKGEDSVVKLRPVEPDQLEAEWRLSPSMKVEVDAMPGGYVCSASLKGKPKTGDTRKVALGEESISRLFSKEQRAFFRAHAPGGIDMGNLAVLGPIFVLKVNFTPEGFSRQVTGEMWLYPDGRRLMELSTKCLPAEALVVATESRLFFADHGIDLSGTQETKTKSALQFFAKELRPGNAATTGGIATETENGDSPSDGAEPEGAPPASAMDGGADPAAAMAAAADAVGSATGDGTTDDADPA